jgi:hypothetical protein
MDAGGQAAPGKHHLRDAVALPTFNRKGLVDWVSTHDVVLGGVSSLRYGQPTYGSHAMMVFILSAVGVAVLLFCTWAPLVWLGAFYPVVLRLGGVLCLLHRMHEAWPQIVKDIGRWEPDVCTDEEGKGACTLTYLHQDNGPGTLEFAWTSSTGTGTSTTSRLLVDICEVTAQGVEVMKDPQHRLLLTHPIHMVLELKSVPRATTQQRPLGQQAASTPAPLQHRQGSCGAGVLTFACPFSCIGGLAGPLKMDAGEEHAPNTQAIMAAGAWAPRSIYSPSLRERVMWVNFTAVPFAMLIWSGFALYQNTEIVSRSVSQAWNEFIVPGFLLLGDRVRPITDAAESFVGFLNSVARSWGEWFYDVFRPIILLCSRFAAPFMRLLEKLVAAGVVQKLTGLVRPLGKLVISVWSTLVRLARPVFSNLQPVWKAAQAGWASVVKVLQPFARLQTGALKKLTSLLAMLKAGWGAFSGFLQRVAAVPTFVQESGAKKLLAGLVKRCWKDRDALKVGAVRMAARQQASPLKVLHKDSQHTPDQPVDPSAHERQSKKDE